MSKSPNKSLKAKAKRLTIEYDDGSINSYALKDDETLRQIAITGERELSSENGYRKHGLNGKKSYMLLMGHPVEFIDLIFEELKSIMEDRTNG